ncbi:sigma-54-dependent Fis family transcriptional regulator [bacterium]|nr:sigma-54-dependent Fis family transcriptional regulator [candidate division CSSED10-310 bacterium]
MSPSILVVDDEQSMLDVLSVMLEKDGHTVYTASSGMQALELLDRDGSFELAISDIRIPDIDGISLLRRFKSMAPSMDVIMITAFSSMETMVEALKEGASDYIIKPFGKDQMRIVVRRVIEQRKLREENIFLRRRLQTRYGKQEIIGTSRQIKEIFNTIKRVADLPSTVLITGDSGTGKELVASAIHYSGIRGTQPFVTVNCGALPETLLESELFGHKKGAFTGAIDNKQGLLEFANHGTFFLDEVGDMSPAVQVKLLRFLNDKKFKRIGGIKDISVDVRIIAATNRSLESLIKEGKFRQDLFYRLNVIPVHIPPLRERREDIPMLVEHFLDKYCRQCGAGKKTVAPDALQTLISADWPGNVRELENVLERIAALEPGPVLHNEHLPPHIRLSDASSPLSNERILNRFQKEGIDLDEFLDTMERDLLEKALETSNGVKKAAARLLNVSFRSFRYRLEKHGMDKQDDPGESV